MQNGHLGSLDRDSVEGDRKRALQFTMEVGGGLTTSPGGAEDQVQMLEAIVAGQMLAQIQSGNFPHRHFQLLEVWHRPKSPNLKKANWIYL